MVFLQILSISLDTFHKVIQNEKKLIGRIRQEELLCTVMEGMRFAQ